MDNTHLLFKPTLGSKESDSADAIKFEHPNLRKDLSHGPHFSECVRDNFKELFNKTKAKSILEIGVDRERDSSTDILLTEKSDDCVYLGVDIRDVSYLDDEGKNIHTIRTSSMNKENVYSKMEQLKIKQFDFIFIDGWHSIDTVLYEWENYVIPFLSKKGIALFHDVNTHPGPFFLFEAIDKEIFNVEKFCDDFGLGLVSYK